MTYSPAVRMIPGPLWGYNLRRAIPKSQWAKIRKKVIDERGLVCETCGKVAAESGKIFAHEVWEYVTSSDQAVAHLTGVVLSCWHCHAVEHFGGTGRMVGSGELSAEAIDDTIDHFCCVNNVDVSEFEKHLSEAKAEWVQLSELEWVVDWGEFSELVDRYEKQRTNGVTK